jgi:hypothetical protein
MHMQIHYSFSCNHDLQGPSLTTGHMSSALGSMRVSTRSTRLPKVNQSHGPFHRSKVLRKARFPVNASAAPGTEPWARTALDQRCSARHDTSDAPL